MTNFILGALAAVALTVAAAGASQAETVSVEAKAFQADHGQNYGSLDTTLSTASVYGSVASGEIELLQAAHNGTVLGNVSFGLSNGYLTNVLGHQVVFGYGAEVGDSFQPKTNNLFYGVAVSAGTPITLPATLGVTKPVGLTLSYRLREGFGNSFAEQRRIGLSTSYAVTDSTTVSANVYREHAAFLNKGSATDSTVFGAELVHKF